MSSSKFASYEEIAECEIVCNLELVKCNRDEKPDECGCFDTDDGDCSPDGECANVQSSFECPKTCKMGSKCKNQRFKNHKYTRVEVRGAGEKGRGLFATELIKGGTFIMEYTGEIIDNKECSDRNKKYKNEGRVHIYMFELTDKTTVDATLKGNVSRFINHSCDPNSKPEKWRVGRYERIGFFALRDIQKEEEITFDYQFGASKQAQNCLCESYNCCGMLIRKEKSSESPPTIHDMSQSSSESEEEGEVNIKIEPNIKIECSERTTDQLKGYRKTKRVQDESIELSESLRNIIFPPITKQAILESIVTEPPSTMPSTPLDRIRWKL